MHFFWIVFVFEMFSRIIIISFLWILCGGIIATSLIICEYFALFIIVHYYKNIIIPTIIA